MGKVEVPPTHMAEGIPGTFLCAASAKLRFHRRRDLEAYLYGPDDPCRHRVYIADTVDGLQLRVITSRDPSEGPWRLSATVVDHDDYSPRYPSWDELKCARYHLLPRHVHMAYVLPSIDSASIYVDAMPTCLQLIEVPAETVL